MLIAFFFFIKVIIPVLLKDEGPGILIVGFDPQRNMIT
jgi:hypothetical protein